MNKLKRQVRSDLKVYRTLTTMTVALSVEGQEIKRSADWYIKQKNLPFPPDALHLLL